MLHDLRYAARTLSNNPGFAAIAILAIALGIGVNTGIFSLLNSITLRPLPVPRAEQLTSVHQTIQSPSRRSTHGSASFFSTGEYETYRDQNHVFDGLLAYAPFVSATLGGEIPRPDPIALNAGGRRRAAPVTAGVDFDSMESLGPRSSANYFFATRR